MSPPKELLDHVHDALERFPIAIAVFAALFQIACAIGMGVLLAMTV